MENNALAMEKIQGNKNESSLAARKHQEFSKWNKVLLYLGWEERDGGETAAGREGTAGERADAAGQAHNCGAGTDPKGCSLSWFPVGPLGRFFFPELPL